jgi:hypothetical protein
VSPLLSRQVDEILGAIDTVVPRRGTDYSGTSTIRYWGVFDVGRNVGHQVERNASPVSGCSHDERYSHDSLSDEASQEGNWLVDDSEARSDSTSPHREALLGPEDPPTRVQPLPIPVSLCPGHTQASRSSPKENDNAQSDRDQLSLYEVCGTIYKSPKPVNLSCQDRFLLYHYSQRVVNLFCVVGNPKTPWKLIHLPRVIQSVGDLSITGSVTQIRSALKSALLSVSAFCISNDHKNRQEIDKSDYWSNEAMLLRGKAIQHLKLAVEHDFRPEAAPRYKDFLATMLSMISINVNSLFLLPSSAQIRC